MATSREMADLLERKSIKRFKFTTIDLMVIVLSKRPIWHLKKAQKNGKDPNDVMFNTTGCFDTGPQCRGKGHVEIKMTAESRF
jgi:hypothetical protein